MADGIVIYKSKYGSTKKYAQWIAEELDYHLEEIDNVTYDQISNYSTLIYGGGVYASGLSGIKKFKKLLSSFKDKKVVLFIVGASPYDEKFLNVLKEKISKEGLENAEYFYFRGAWDLDNMTFIDKNLCKILINSVSKKDEGEMELWEKALVSTKDVEGPVDWTNKENIKPLVDYINNCKKC